MSQDTGDISGSRASAPSPSAGSRPIGFDPGRMAKILRDLVADERSMSEAIRLPEYKCELIEDAAAILEAIANTETPNGN